MASIHAERFATSQALAIDRWISGFRFLFVELQNLNILQFLAKK
jgi:hypothetical protein